METEKSENTAQISVGPWSQPGEARRLADLANREFTVPANEQLGRIRAVFDKETAEVRATLKGIAERVATIRKDLDQTLQSAEGQLSSKKIALTAMASSEEQADLSVPGTGTALGDLRRSSGSGQHISQAVASREAAPQVRSILGCFLFTGDDVFKKIGVLSGGERSRVALTCMLLKPANFLILDEPTNHLDMQSQGVLQRALLDYPGSVMIVSHNRDFLDSLVTKTLEFRPGEEPRLFHGNIAYYLDKKAEEKSGRDVSPKRPSNAPPATTAEVGRDVSPKRPAESVPGVNRKEQRKLEALAREAKTKILAPLEKELETLEAKIAEQEAAQATLTAALSKDEISGDPEKLRQTTNAVEKVTKTLELAYTRWSALTEEIEQVKAKHGL